MDNWIIDSGTNITGWFGEQHFCLTHNTAVYWTACIKTIHFQSCWYLGKTAGSLMWYRNKRQKHIQRYFCPIYILCFVIFFCKMSVIPNSVSFHIVKITILYHTPLVPAILIIIKSLCHWSYSKIDLFWLVPAVCWSLLSSEGTLISKSWRGWRSCHGNTFIIPTPVTHVLAASQQVFLGNYGKAWQLTNTHSHI